MNYGTEDGWAYEYATAQLAASMTLARMVEICDQMGEDEIVTVDFHELSSVLLDDDPDEADQE